MILAVVQGCSVVLEEISVMTHYLSDIPVHSSTLNLLTLLFFVVRT
jgi:hypothetical protein